MRQNLKNARLNAKMTQQSVADEIHVSLRYYQQLEAGDRNGNFDVWDKLENITGVHQKILRENR